MFQWFTYTIGWRWLEHVGATLYYLLLFIAQAASSTNPPQPWLNPQRFDSLQRSQQGPPSTCKGHCHGDSAWIQEAVRLPWDLIIAVTVIRYEWLVGGWPTPKNMKVSWEGLSHILWNNKTCSKPPTSYRLQCYIIQIHRSHFRHHRHPF